MNLRSIKRGPPARTISDKKLVRLFNDLYTEFQSRLVDHRFHEPDIHGSPARYPTGTNSGWVENRSWIYHGRTTYELTMFTTTKGFIGLATTDVVSGDIIGLFHLHTQPCVLRPREGGRHSFHGFVAVESTASGDLETFCGNDFFAPQRFILC